MTGRLVQATACRPSRSVVNGVSYGSIDVKDVTIPAPLEADSVAANRGAPRSRQEIVARVQREPLAIATLLARKYPETPLISYIPAISWTQTWRLAPIVKDDSLREKVRQQIQPWMSGEKDAVRRSHPAHRRRRRDDLRGAGGGRRRDRASPRQRVRAARGGAQADRHRGARSGVDRRHVHGGERASRAPACGPIIATRWTRPAQLLIDYAARLQQPSGLFNHASDGPAAWGRGNGFAAFGLMETLTVMPASHPSRAQLLEILRRQMQAVKAQQSPDGAWRQIVDEPGAYREETATAMLTTVIARGIRLGWLDRSFLPVGAARLACARRPRRGGWDGHRRLHRHRRRPDEALLASIARRSSAPTTAAVRWRCSPRWRSTS